MINILGKGLVLIYTIFCLMGLMLAIVVYFDFIDWGRSEPRVVHGEPTKGSAGGNDMRIASQYERSKAVFDNAREGRDLVVTPLAPAEAALREAQDRFAQNHLFYVAELRKLEKEPGNIEVKRLPPDGLQTDMPGKAIGKPIPSLKVAELDKSWDSYTAMLKMEQDKIAPIEKAVHDLAKKDSDISYELTGKNAEGKQVAHGLFDLVDLEFSAQQRLMEEYAYTQPQWASMVEEARRYSNRRVSLEGTLNGLEKALKEKRAKQK